VSVVVVGLNHRTAPLGLLERVAVGPERLAKALHDVGSRPNVSEVVLLSTCNRTEVYAVAERFHGAYQDIRDFLCEQAHLAPEDLSEHLFSAFDDDAVSHLFSVAAGLDSAVIGENEILGQVRGAWERAQGEGAARTGLNLLFRHSIEVGKRARTETAISRGTASMSYAAVAMATERLGGLTGASVLVIGAGEMGEGLAVALADGGVGDMVVANRTASRARALARRVGGRPIGLADIEEALVEVDVLLSSTGGGQVLLDRDTLESLLPSRQGRALLVVDVAVPRDIEPTVGTLPGVTYLDLDDLGAFAARGVAGREAEAAEVRRIVADEVVRYSDLVSARQVAPLVSELHGRAESVRRNEFERFRARLSTLDDSQRDAVEALTRGVVAKLLHDPTVRLKDAAGTLRGERLADALRELFDLS
jgi:glutamyl-tRNA reductase